jgi:hypothetical protein
LLQNVYWPSVLANKNRLIGESSFIQIPFDFLLCNLFPLLPVVSTFVWKTSNIQVCYRKLVSTSSKLKFAESIFRFCKEYSFLFPEIRFEFFWLHFVLSFFLFIPKLIIHNFLFSVYKRAIDEKKFGFNSKSKFIFYVKIRNIKFLRNRFCTLQSITKITISEHLLLKMIILSMKWWYHKVLIYFWFAWMFDSWMFSF